MPDVEKKDTRPFWRRKTDIGIWIAIAGEIMAFIPFTAPYAPVIIKIGMVLAGAGIVHRNIKENAAAKAR